MARIVLESLFAKPGLATFNAGEESLLMQYLQRRTASRRVEFVSEIQDLQLYRNGRTQAGYQYTSFGFLRVCRYLGAGLSTIVRDVFGVVRRSDMEAWMFDPARAVHIFNDVLSLRFQRMTERQMVRSEDEKLLEGLIGAKHRLLDNYEFCDMTRQLLAQQSRPICLHQATVNSRRLVLCFRAQDPVLQIKIGGQTLPIYDGYYLINSEVGGGIHGLHALFSSLGRVLGESSDELRIAHAGKKFQQRLADMLYLLTSQRHDVNLLQKIIMKAIQAPMITTTAGEDERERCEKRIGKHLHQCGVPKWLLSDVFLLARQLSEGADVNLLHLVQALSCQVAKMDLDRRQQLEQLNYQLLFGGIKLGSAHG